MPPEVLDKMEPLAGPELLTRRGSGPGWPRPLTQEEREVYAVRIIDG